MDNITIILISVAVISCLFIFLKNSNNNSWSNIIYKSKIPHKWKSETQLLKEYTDYMVYRIKNADEFKERTYKENELPMYMWFLCEQFGLDVTWEPMYVIHYYVENWSILEAWEDVLRIKIWDLDYNVKAIWNWKIELLHNEWDFLVKPDPLYIIKKTD